MDLRQYDPAIARWTGIDPVTHHSMSTYTAFDNNPVFWADPSGADTESFIRGLFESSASGTTWTNTGNGNFSNGKGRTESCNDCPQEGQTRSKKVPHINALDGMEGVTTVTEYYHSGGINGSEAGWYSGQQYGSFFDNFIKEMAFGGALSKGSMEWISQNGSPELLMAIIMQAERFNSRRFNHAIKPMGFDSPFFIVGGFAKLFTQAKRGTRIALGVREYLDDFASSVKGTTWKTWGSDNFQSQFLQVISSSKSKIHFNLDGIDNVWKAVQEGARGLGNSRVTSWELYQVYSNPQVLQRTIFYQNGKVVPSPF